MKRLFRWVNLRRGEGRECDKDKRERDQPMSDEDAADRERLLQLINSGIAANKFPPH
jgi:hypothetical protein